MAFKFNPNLDYQNDAVKAVTNLFKGQERTYSSFTIYDPVKYKIQTVIDGGTEQNEVGVANNLILDEEDISNNLRQIQRQNHLNEYIGELKKNNLNFAVEMETGERVIIVTGCIKTLESRVSGTFTQKFSCIA